MGSASTSQAGWISTNVGQLDLLKKASWDRFLGNRRIDALLAEHVWEHLSIDEGRMAASICYSHMKSGGYMRIAVPDGNHPNPDYIENVKVGGVGPGAEDHKVLFDYKSLSDMFEEAGFAVKLLEYFDESGIFHQDDWCPDAGFINRSKRYDKRNADGNLNYTSIIIDAVKID